MNRNSETDVIILKNSRIGDIHKGVTMLSPQQGLLSAIAHGAYSQKGKLRGVTNPFCYGRCYLYTDPVKKSIKITDLSVNDFFSGLRESVTRFYSASLWAELVLKTFGGGAESDRLFALLLDALRALDSATDFRPVSIQFLWRYLETAGLQPELDTCGDCGAELAADSRRYYDPRQAGFVCANCANRSAAAALGPAAAGYLQYSGQLDFSAALKIRLDDGALQNARTVLYRLVQDVAETPLNSLRIGGGIL